MNFNTYLKLSLENEGIECSSKKIEKFSMYKDLLLDWNQKINLTSITEEIPMAEKHFYDSIMMMKYVNLSGKSVIDIGTGAGFPGVPLKIMDESINLTLLDSLNKRLNFLKEVGKDLELENVKYLHGRAEDFSHNKDYREKFDFATSRAVARLNILLEYCLPYVKTNGYFIALKGKECKDEILESKNALKILGGEVSFVEEYELKEDKSIHYLVIIKKISTTPKKYPRKAGTPTKSPII